jgi:hypothetical protein
VPSGTNCASEFETPNNGDVKFPIGAPGFVRLNRFAIADRVVRLHNGSIEAYNAREGGLVIDINLPLKQ